MAQRCGLVVGLLLFGCAREAPLETAATAPERTTPLLGEPCPLSAAPQVSSNPPRVFVELATLEGDLLAIQKPSAAAGQAASAPRSFWQMLADPRWRAINVRHIIASDGISQTFPWDFEPPRASSTCPADARWELSMTAHVIEQSPVTVRIDVQIAPAPPPGTAPDTWRAPLDCGAKTTVVLRDQQLVVLSGFPTSDRPSSGLMTTVTPYVIREDADLRRLLECKRKRAQTNVAEVRAIPPQTVTASPQ